MVAKHEVREYTGEAKVFIAKYQNLNNLLHWHYDCELVYVASGSLDVYLSGRHYTLGAGQVMYIGNMEEHSIRTKEKAEVYMLIFSYDIIKNLLKNIQLAGPVLSHDYDFMRLYQFVRRELTEKAKYSGEIIAADIVLTVLQIFRGEDTLSAAVRKKDKIEFMRLLDDIDKNFAYYTSENAAEFLFMSKVYFSKYFHKMSGMVFTDYLNTVKIGKAVEMIQRGGAAPMSDIASKCGFNTIRNFNRVFKLLTGFNPTRVPADYAYEDAVFFSSDSVSEGFDPTLRETVTIESLGGSAT